jgi:hypothetical protein
VDRKVPTSHQPDRSIREATDVDSHHPGPPTTFLNRRPAQIRVRRYMGVCWRRRMHRPNPGIVISGQTYSRSNLDPVCSFCHRKRSERNRRVIAGPDRVYICDECVDLCVDRTWSLIGRPRQLERIEDDHHVIVHWLPQTRQESDLRIAARRETQVPFPSTQANTSSTRPNGRTSTLIVRVTHRECLYCRARC